MSLAACTPAYGAPAAAGTTAVAVTTEATDEPTADANLGAQSEERGEWVNSGEVDYVKESELSRKMKQAEKARNAAANDKYGVAITIIAMGIVLMALVVLSLLFLGFGKISSLLLSRRKMKSHGVSREEAQEEHTELDSGETIAAIAMALSDHFNQQHDIEDTILTIRRMRKAYSPWNSKIYNMRHVPETHHNNPLRRK